MELKKYSELTNEDIASLNIRQKIAYVQWEVKKIEKTGKVSFGTVKYNSVELAEIVDTLTPFLEHLGLNWEMDESEVTTTNLTSKLVNAATADGIQTTNESIAPYLFIDGYYRLTIYDVINGSEITRKYSASSLLNEEYERKKGGKATYAKKYLLLNAFGLATDDKDDAEYEPKQKGETPLVVLKAEKTAVEQRIENLITIIKENKKEDEAVIKIIQKKAGKVNPDEVIKMLKNFNINSLDKVEQQINEVRKNVQQK